MKLEEVLKKDQLEEIKKIGQVSEELKAGLYSQELNTETQKILIQIVDKDAEDLIRGVIDDVFFEYLNEKIQ